MKKLILLTAPFIIMSLYAAKDRQATHSKQQNADMPRVYLSPPPPPKCPSDVVVGKVEMYASNTSTDIPPYTHCTECNLGAMLGDKGQEKCTYCGYPSKKYNASIAGE